MNDKKIRQIIEDELSEKRWALTEQYLDCHNVVYNNGTVVIDRVDRETNDGTIIAYLPVENENFHFAIFIDSETQSFAGIDTESWNRIYFRATSETLSLEEISAFTKLSPTRSWNIGDLRKDGKTKYNFTSFEIQPNPEPDEFEDKLIKLLDFLHEDKDGVKTLVEKANGFIQAAIEFHDGNSMLGGLHLDSEIIHRMSNLNLKIDIDLYTSGNKFE